MALLYSRSLLMSLFLLLPLLRLLSLPLLIPRRRFVFFFLGFTNVIDNGDRVCSQLPLSELRDDNVNGYDFDSSSRLSFPIIHTTGTSTVLSS